MIFNGQPVSSILSFVKILLIELAMNEEIFFINESFDNSVL